jgi:hypothetical protein
MKIFHRQNKTIRVTRMKSTVGIFKSRTDAERAVERLRSIGFDQEHLSLLIPGSSQEKAEAVATTETEQPGMGKAIGGVVGGALGAAGGMHIGAAAASLLVPGVGPIFAIGAIGAVLLGAGGAAAGAAVGEELEESMDEGLPRDELYLYEDALRRGRSVVIALAEDDDKYGRAQRIMDEEGAESLDRAREDWWVGLRDDEELSYTAEGGDFHKDEIIYRRGFESALHPKARGKSYDEAAEFISSCYGDICNETPFRRGYERGSQYHKREQEKHKD